jgi:hypothetical protein
MAPDPVIPYQAADERQRSSSSSDTTPRAARSLASAQTASSSQSVFGGNNGKSGGDGAGGGTGPPSFPRKDSGVSVRDVAQPSGRASPALSLSRSLRATQASRPPFRSPPIPTGSASNTSTLKNLDSYSASRVAAALEPGAEVRQLDDMWQMVCVRVLPLLYVSEDVERGRKGTLTAGYQQRRRNPRLCRGTQRPGHFARPTHLCPLPILSQLPPRPDPFHRRLFPRHRPSYCRPQRTPANRRYDPLWEALSSRASPTSFR